MRPQGLRRLVSALACATAKEIHLTDPLSAAKKKNALEALGAIEKCFASLKEK